LEAGDYAPWPTLSNRSVPFRDLDRIGRAAHPSGRLTRR